MIRNRKVLVTLAMIFILSSCVTQKRKDDVSALGKLYHNTTSKYNGYFNADELYTATVLSLSEQHQDNYTRILPIYPERATDNPQAVAGDMDKAVEKVSRVVTLHPNSQWSDDCYLLAGKAQYLKQDFETAEATFRYLVNNFDPVEIAAEEELAKATQKNKKGSAKKKKKKTKKKSARQKKREYYRNKRRRKKGKAVKDKKEELAESKKKAIKEAKKATYQEPDNYTIRHRPAYQEGQLWLARTLVERDNFDAAQRMLTGLLNNENTYEDVAYEAWKALAYYQLESNDYAGAVTSLENAIESAPQKRHKARLGYIVAQIYETQNQGQKAYAAFERVLRFAPAYEMEFNCRMNMAMNAWRANKGSAENALADLEKLLKDDKNLDYQDQVYFAMAQIALAENQKEQAIEYFKLSLRTSKNNKIQKAESYLALAELYFQGEVFVPAKNYYDSTLTVINKKDPRFDQIKNLSDNLTEIAANLLIIEEQDSLLKLSYLSEDEKRDLAFRMLKAKQEAARKAATSGTGTTPPATSFAANRPATPALQNESTFFAYDDRNIKRGIRDFKRKWGNRPLEDNWRRSGGRLGSGGFDETDLNPVETVDASDALTDDQLEELLADIPKDDSERKKAELKIVDAMYALGTLYRDRLENNQKAVEILEGLNERFPKNNYELESWFYLYLAYQGLNNRIKSEEYKQAILERYSTSIYARVLRDPTYAQKVANEELAMNTYYDEAYAAFEGGNFKRSFQLANDAKVKFGNDNVLQPRFDLLAAMSTGNIEGEQAYKNALSQVIAKHPNTDEQRKAREILRLLSGATASLPGAQQEIKANFKLDDKQVHFIIIAFNQDINLNEAKVALSDYNRNFHKTQRLSISNVFLGNNANDRVPMLIVRRFKDRAEAMAYYESSVKNRKDFMIPDVEFNVFAISLNNYREILRSKSVVSYQSFFESNYL